MTNLFYLVAAKGTSDSEGILFETTKNVSALSNYWASIDWDSIISMLISKTATILIVSILLLVVNKVGLRLIRSSFNKYKEKKDFSKSRLNTLETLASNTFHYLLFFIYLYSILTVIGIPVGSLIAGAGIAGIAIGLGAQGFINDLITGFFIIFERQIDVNDYVRIGTIEGTVLTVGLRTTQIKGFDGTIHFLPNRTISIISNLSRSNMRALINVRVNPGDDVETIKDILASVNKKMVPDYPEIKSGPDILGPIDLGAGNFSVQVVMYTLNGSQYKIQRDFLAAYILALQEKGITIPNTPINLAN